LNGSFDAVINAVGVLNQFAEQDKAAAAYANAYLPHYLARITKDLDTQIIHMSTDCVFSGMTGGYTETSLRDGSTFYDRSKALGELEDEKNITIRTSIVGPDLNPNGIGLLNWFMRQSGEIEGYSKAMWTGMTTLELAKAMEAATLCRASGLYNLVNGESISKYHLLELFNTYLRDNEITIKPSDSLVSDKTLVRANFGFSHEVPSYESMIDSLANWMNFYADLYPHYSIRRNKPSSLMSQDSSYPPPPALCHPREATKPYDKDLSREPSDSQPA
jgi:dTDP-4-dehydrorhamnose reductase